MNILDTSEATTTLLYEELKKNSEIKGQPVSSYQPHANGQMPNNSTVLTDDDISLVNFIF